VETGLSIGTTIKRKAILLLDKLQEEKVLLPRERKIMSNGLSSILDLVDESYESQRSLFTAKEWNLIKKNVMTRYPLQAVEKNLELASIWQIIYGTMQTTRDLKHGTLYIYEMYQKHYGSALMPALRVMEHIVESVYQYSHLLECEFDTTATEYDYLGYLWMPLFRRLINDLTIRLKSGESAYHYSTKNKQDLYFDASRVNGFKIDLRLLTDANDTEYDICSMEVCCDDKNDGNMVNDEGKLNREMKDDLDCMIDLGLQPDECCSWGVQVSGSSCLIMSTHLIDNSLYVVIPRFELSLPSSLADLKVFMETMDKLLIFRHHICQVADAITKRTKRKNSFDTLTNHSRQPKSLLQRSTWYTPVVWVVWLLRSTMKLLLGFLFLE
jgi:hypothetical protein